LPSYIKALRHPHFLKIGDPAALARKSMFVSYGSWIARRDFDEERDGAEILRAIEGIENPPLISVLMPVYNTPERLLREAVESVRNQIYTNWQLCIADDFSTEPRVKRILSEYAAQDHRIK